MLHLSLCPAQVQDIKTRLPQKRRRGTHRPAPASSPIQSCWGHQGQAASRALGVGPLFLQKGGFCELQSHKLHSRPSGIFAVFCSPSYNLCTPVQSATKARGPAPHALSIKPSPPLLQVAWCLYCGSAGVYPWSCVCLCPITAFRQAGRFLMTTWKCCFGQNNSCKYSSGNQTLYCIRLIFNARLKNLSMQKNHCHLFISLGGPLTKMEKTVSSVPLSIFVILPMDFKKNKSLLVRENLTSNSRGRQHLLLFYEFDHTSTVTIPLNH